MEVCARAKHYSGLKYRVSIAQGVYLVLLLLLFATSGASELLASRLSILFHKPYVILTLYLTVAYIAYGMFNFPLAFYQSYVLEHSVGLSRQKWTGWAMDQLKAAVLVFLISFIFFDLFYHIVRRYPAHWWLVVSFAWVLISVVIAKLSPLVIIPLFFKYKPLTDDALRSRIAALAEKMKVKILGVFEIDMSSKTVKANAAFVGMGSTRRILLADTLRDKYSHDEIEVILAHEFSHYRMNHLLKLIALKSAGVFFICWLMAATGSSLVRYCGAFSLGNLAAFPLVLLYFVVIGAVMEPLEHYVSRRMERHADIAALKATGLTSAFISMMEKLGDQNLADRSPSPLIKFLFFDHPPIDERIALARSFTP